MYSVLVPVQYCILRVLFSAAGAVQQCTMLDVQVASLLNGW